MSEGVQVGALAFHVIDVSLGANGAAVAVSADYLDDAFVVKHIRLRSVDFSVLNQDALLEWARGDVFPIEVGAVMVFRSIERNTAATHVATTHGTTA